nr:protein FATTY ACID EXPORT 1, chloroplastic [Ipomoea batatas]
MSSAAISQLSCFSSVTRRAQLRSRFSPSPALRPKLQVFICMSNDGRGTDVSSVEDKSALSYTTDPLKPHGGRPENPLSASEESVTGKNSSDPLQGTNDLAGENITSQPIRAAKIHDFCFGIPFGTFVLSGGLLGFIFSRNITTLGNGVLFGGALLALSTVSLKVWRQGKSSLPFILGQAVLAGFLLWKNVQTYSLTKKVFPTGLYAAISAAMLCFYFYVVISGGNPPPKKMKSSAVAAS